MPLCADWAWKKSWKKPRGNYPIYINIRTKIKQLENSICIKRHMSSVVSFLLLKRGSTNMRVWRNHDNTIYRISIRRERKQGKFLLWVAIRDRVSGIFILTRHNSRNYNFLQSAPPLQLAYLKLFKEYLQQELNYTRKCMQYC